MHINIIVPAFNVARYLGDAIRSVIGQTHPDWTIVVVDDGSTDGTGRVARRFADPRMKVIRQDNAGVSAARNRGMAGCDGDAVLFLDADDWLAPDALAALARALAADPAAVAAVGGFARIDLAGRCQAPRPPMGGDLLRPLLHANRFLNGGHVLARRSAVRRAGGFLHHLSFGEDWEFWVRLAMQGRFAALPNARPVLFARERRDGACHPRAADPAAYRPPMQAIFGNPALQARFDPPALQRLRSRAEAEASWTAGRALLRQGRITTAWPWLLRSIVRLPRLRRIALLTAVSASAALPARWMVSYATVDPDQRTHRPAQA